MRNVAAQCCADARRAADDPHAPAVIPDSFSQFIGSRAGLSDTRSPRNENDVIREEKEGGRDKKRDRVSSADTDVDSDESSSISSVKQQSLKQQSVKVEAKGQETESKESRDNKESKESVEGLAKTRTESSDAISEEEDARLRSIREGAARALSRKEVASMVEMVSLGPAGAEARAQRKVRERTPQAVCLLKVDSHTVSYVCLT